MECSKVNVALSINPSQYSKVLVALETAEETFFLFQICLWTVKYFFTLCRNISDFNAEIHTALPSKLKERQRIE